MWAATQAENKTQFFGTTLSGLHINTVVTTGVDVTKSVQGQLDPEQAKTSSHSLSDLPGYYDPYPYNASLTWQENQQTWEEAEVVAPPNIEKYESVDSRNRNILTNNALFTTSHLVTNIIVTASHSFYASATTATMNNGSTIVVYGTMPTQAVKGNEYVCQNGIDNELCPSSMVYTSMRSYRSSFLGDLNTNVDLNVANLGPWKPNTWYNNVTTTLHPVKAWDLQCNSVHDNFASFGMFSSASVDEPCPWLRLHLPRPSHVARVALVWDGDFESGLHAPQKFVIHMHPWVHENYYSEFYSSKTYETADCFTVPRRDTIQSQFTNNSYVVSSIVINILKICHTDTVVHTMHSICAPLRYFATNIRASCRY